MSRVRAQGMTTGANWSDMPLPGANKKKRVGPGPMAQVLPCPETPVTQVDSLFEV